MTLFDDSADSLPAELNGVFTHDPPDSVTTIFFEPGRDISPALSQRKPVQVVFKRAAGLWPRTLRFFYISRTCKTISKAQFDCRPVGISGTLDSPEVLCSLQHNVLWYANIVTFRFSDSPVRLILKRLLGLFPGALLWSGPVFLYAQSQSAETTDSCTLSLSDCCDRLTLFSADRQVSFLFNGTEKWPFAVRKQGDPQEIAVEYSHHRRALQLLGCKVPALLDEITSEQTDFFTLEYIPEYTLVNRVAEVWRDRQGAFVREATGHLTFCCDVYWQLLQAIPAERVTVTDSEVNGLLGDLSTFLDDSTASQKLQVCLRELVGLSLPKMVQHGDFCVRNVLIVGGSRGRVLIDWEDLQESRWAFVDFVLLRLSLKQAYVTLFHGGAVGFATMPVLVAELKEMEGVLMKLLDISQSEIWAVELLSLASLCRQNLVKNRQATAEGIFKELIECLHQQTEQRNSS